MALLKPDLDGMDSLEQRKCKVKANVLHSIQTYSDDVQRQRAYLGTDDAILV